jgi:hypothetical protein
MTEKKSDQSKKRVYTKKASSRGGARTGAGRPKGSTTKIKIEDLMQNIENIAGVPYGELLAKNYVEAINRSDWNGVRDYDKAFMNKMIAEKVEVDVNHSEDVLAQKQAAFAQAIAQITGIKPKD